MSRKGGWVMAVSRGAGRRWSQDSGGRGRWGAGRVDAGRVKQLCSTALFLEYEAVLGRAEMRAVTGHSLDDVAAVMNALAAVCEPVDISFRVRPVLRDADDEMVLEAAVNGQADAIVTRNAKDFSSVGAFGIEIAAPGEILGRLVQ